MKTIYKGKNDLYYVFSISAEDSPGVPLTPQELEKLSVDFYTSGDASVHFEKSDITPEGILYLNADSLATLPDGPLRMRVQIGLPDSGFDDDQFDQMAERMTGYFIKTFR